jgi:Arc/MetJ family transcription regulator
MANGPEGTPPTDQEVKTESSSDGKDLAEKFTDIPEDPKGQDLTDEVNFPAENQATDLHQEAIDRNNQANEGMTNAPLSKEGQDFFREEDDLSKQAKREANRVKTAQELAMEGKSAVNRDETNPTTTVEPTPKTENQKGTPLKTALELAMEGKSAVNRDNVEPKNTSDNIDERSAEAQATLRHFRNQTQFDPGESIPDSQPQRPIPEESTQSEQGKDTGIDGLSSFGDPISEDMDDMTKRRYENSLRQHIEHTDDVLGKMRDQMNRAGEEETQPQPVTPRPETTDPDKVDPTKPDPVEPRPEIPPLPPEITVILQQIQQNQDVLLQIVNKLPEDQRSIIYNITVENMSDINGLLNSQIAGRDNIGGDQVGGNKVEGDGNTATARVTDESSNETVIGNNNQITNNPDRQISEEGGENNQSSGMSQTQQQSVYVTPGQTPAPTPVRTPETTNIDIENTTNNILNNLRSEVQRLEQLLQNDSNLTIEQTNYIENLVGSLKIQINDFENIQGDISIDQREGGESTDIDQTEITNSAEALVNLNDQEREELEEAGKTNKGFFATIQKVFKSKGGWKGFITSVSKRFGSSLAISGAAAGVTTLFGPVGAAVVGGAMVGMGVWTIIKAKNQAQAEADRRGIKMKELWKDKEFRKGLITGALTSGVGRAGTMLASGLIPGLGNIGGVLLSATAGMAIDTGFEVKAEMNKNKAKKELMEGYEQNHRLRKYNEIKNNEYIGFSESGGDIYAGKKSVNIEKILADLQAQGQSPEHQAMAKKIAAATQLEIYNHTKDDKYRYIPYKEGDEVKQLDLSKFKIGETEQSVAEYETLDFEPTIDKYVDTLDTTAMTGLLQEGWNSIDENDITDLGMKIVRNYAGLESAEIDKILTDERRIYLNSVSYLTGFRTASAVVNGLFVVGVGGFSAVKGLAAMNEQNQQNTGTQPGQQELQETRDAIQDDNAEVEVYENQNGEKVYKVDLDGDNDFDMYRTENGDMMATTNEGAAKMFELENSLQPDSVSVNTLNNSTTGVSGTIVDANGDVVGVVVEGGNGALGTMPIENLDAPISAVDASTGQTVDLDIVNVNADGTATVEIGGQQYETNIATLDDIPGMEAVDAVAGAGSIPIEYGDSMPTLLQKSLTDAMEHNPQLQEAYNNDQYIMERMLYEGDYLGNDAQIRNELGIGNPVKLTDANGNFDYAESPSIMNMLQRLNGGNPINLPDGTDGIAGSPGYNLSMGDFDIDGFDVGELSGTEVSTDVSGSEVLGGLIMGVANVFDKDTGNYISRETTIEQSNSKGKGGQNSRGTSSSSSNSDDSSNSSSDNNDAEEGTNNTGESVETTTETTGEQNDQEETTDPMEGFNSAIQTIIRSSKKNNSKIIIDRAAYIYNQDTKTWDYQEIEYGIPYITKKNLNEEQIQKMYTDNMKVGQSNFEKDIRITLEQYPVGESLRIDGILYRKTELSSSNGTQLLWVPAQNSPQEVREKGNITDAKLAHEIRELGVKGAKEQVALENRQASATAENEQSDQDQNQEKTTEEEKKLERRRKRREFLRKALVFTAGVAAGAATIAFVGTGIGGAVAVAGMLGGSLGTSAWKKAREQKSGEYLSQYHNILEKAQKGNRELTEEEKRLRQQYLEKSEKASKTANTLGYISTFLGGGAVGAGVMQFIQPTIVDVGFKVNPEGWFKGFINTLKPERMPINESFGG